ncbi:MADS-box protein FBP24-like isoform X2 [Cannabis sativa]|uniref:MADS-box protein FBP24-like isoform X2 n=1 Tax=Cannabis sativa TaxID=3483 RepID=UPI0029CA0B31|nr:MADS-box protein FBP24-like isoform X2 [Cannabis sativa]
MGRGKIKISRIENKITRQVTFAKRRAGLLKKTHELAVLCDAQIGLIIFSANGKLYDFCSDPLSMQNIIQKYQLTTGTRIVEQNDTEQLHGEMRRIISETQNLQLSLQRYTGEDLSSLTLGELNELEQVLVHASHNVRARKFEILQQQMENLQRKIKEHQATAAAYEEQNQVHVTKIEEVERMGMNNNNINWNRNGNVLDQFPFSGEVQPSSVLQLATLHDHHNLNPNRLLPTQPNLREYTLD